LKPDVRAIGALRDVPVSGEVPAPPRISRYNEAKIRNVCLLLSIAVVFNHAITVGDLRQWQGESVSGPAAEEISAAPLEAILEYFLSGALGRIANPLFFMVSGYLFFWSWKPDWPSLLRKWRHRAFTLLVPLILWSVLGKALWTLDHLWINRGPVAAMARAGEWGGREVISTFVEMNGPSQLWFIQQLLLLMVLVAPILAWMLPRVGWWIVPPLVILYFTPGMDPLLGIFRKPSLCFFATGALLGIRSHELVLRSRNWSRGVFVFWMVAAIAYTGLAATSDAALGPVLKLVVLIGIAGCWAAYDLLPERLHDWLAVWAPYRFVIYMGFDPLLPILQRHFLTSFSANQASRIAAYLVFPCVVVVICVIAARMLYRLAPGIYFVIAGGRTPPVISRGMAAGQPLRGPAPQRIP
jgi:surface polysaccharide O-acyltransferase-like enzyme